MKKIFAVTLFILTLTNNSLYSQINYSFNFDANSTGWTGDFTRFTGTTACGGSGGAMRRNLYGSVTTGQLISPNAGTSNGMNATVSYTYKAAVWSANTAAASNWGNFIVQYGPTATGPWTNIATVSNEVQLGNACISKSHSVTLPAGNTFVRFAATRQSGDYWLNFDNVVVTQAAATSCSGTPNTGTASISSAGGCSGSAITLSSSGISSGTGVSYQWQSAPAAGGPWTNISGATSSTASVTPLATTFYRMVTTCSNGGATNTTTVVSYTITSCLNVPFTGSNSNPCGANVTLFDHNGSSGDYGNSANGFTVLQNEGSAIISLSGTSIGEACCDYVRIFRGAGTGGVIVGTYYMNTAIPTISSLAGEALTVQFVSDGSVVGAGIQINVTYSGSCVPTSPPSCSSSPTPANGVTGVSVGTTLSWPAVAGASGYDVFFGTSPTPPQVATSQAGTTYNPGTLNASTTYFWRIVPRNSAGLATGCATWSFTTGIPGCNSGVLYTSYTPLCNGAQESYAGCTYAGEYNTLTLTAGIQYAFGSSVTTDYITITDNTGGIITAGTQPINFTPSSAGQYRVFIHTNSACTTATLCRSPWVQCSPSIPAWKTTWVSMNTGAPTWCVGETRNVSVTVTNAGSNTWTNATPDVNIGIKWNAEADYFVRVDANGLVSGATQTYTFSLTAPATAGTNNLSFDVVNEGNFWFANNPSGVGPGNIVYVSSPISIIPLPIVNTGSNISVCSATDTQLSGVATGEVISEQFENIATMGWTVSNMSSPAGIGSWFQGNTAVFTGQSGGYIAANFNSVEGNNTISNWLISNEMTINNGDVISFYTRGPGMGFADRMQLRLSTNGSSVSVGADANSVGDFTTLLLDINPTLAPTGYPATWTLYTITVSGLPSAASGRIAFRYFVTSGGPDGANSDYVGIDNYTYTPVINSTWSPGTSLSSTTILNPVASPVATTTYTLTASQLGCVNSSNVTITVNNPTLATPPANGDMVWRGASNTDWGTLPNWWQYNGTAYVAATAAPTTAQNVIIPQNQTCVSNQPNTFTNAGSAKSLLIESGATLTMGSGSLTVTENWVNNGAFIPGTGTVTFAGTGTHTVSGSAAAHNFNNLIMNKNGEVMLSVSTMIAGSLTLTNGRLNIASFNLDLPTNVINGGNTNSYVKTSGTGTLNRIVGGTAVNFPVGRTAYNPATLTNIGTADKFSIRVINNVTDNGDNADTGPTTSMAVVNRTWMINEQTVGGSNVTLRLQWNDAPEHINGFQPIDDFIAHYISSAGLWDNIGGTTPSANIIETDGITSFSPFTISSSFVFAPLPVELIAFTAHCQNQDVEMKWSTASEHNSLYFNLQVSEDGYNWSDLYVTDAAGFSNVILEYTYTHKTATRNKYYYRLKQYDYDGAFETYNTIVAHCMSDEEVFMTFPNPSADAFTIVVNDKFLSGSNVLTISDASGKIIYSIAVEIENGSGSFLLEGLDLPAGLYYLQLSNGLHTSRVIKHSFR